MGSAPIAGVASATGTQLSSPDEFSSGAITIDFEGLSGPLSDQIPGLKFIPWQTQVIDPVIIGNSQSIPLSAATSGTAQPLVQDQELILALL